MKINTPRQRAIVTALRALIPLAPFADFEAIAVATRARHLRDLSPVDNAWLTTIAHIRHNHTAYDELRNDNYDGDAARFFVVEGTNEVLADWGCARRVDGEMENG